MRQLPKLHLAFSLAFRGLSLFLTLLTGISLQDHGHGQDQPPQVRIHITVFDVQGAVIPGASITVDGTSRAALTNNAGEATLSLLAGTTHLTLTRAGFHTLTRELSLLNATNLTLTLQVASSTDSISIDARSFKAETATSATRTSLSLIDTPQQVQVLTGDLLSERAVESMKQAVEIVPSVTLQLGEGRRDNFFIRGFNAISDMYLDGVRDDAQYYRDLSGTESIEILEGPAAVLYGRGSSGGLIDRITKKPRIEGTLGELTYTAAGYGEQRGTADLDTVVPATRRALGFRLTGAAEHEGSQRHDYWMDRYTFAPTLLWQPEPASAIRLGIERLRDDRLPDRGIPYLPSTGAPAIVPVGNFYGYVGPGPGNNFIHSAVTGGTLDATHSFGSGWALHAVARDAGYATTFLNMYATGVTPTTGTDALVGRGEYNGTQSWNLIFSNLEASRTARLFRMTHTILAGVEYDREATDSVQFNGPTNQTPVDLFNPVLRAPVLSTVYNRNNRFRGNTAGIYGQDLVQLSPRLKALLGVRFDNFGQTLTLHPPTNITPNLDRADRALSPRAGFVYQTTPFSSLYVNYSRTYDPSGENLSLASNTADLKPEVTRNYEGGAKLELLHQKLLVSSSIFHLDRTNIKTTDPANPLALLNLGEQRTNGAELSFQGSLRSGWMIYGGYAWLDGRIISSTTASNGVSLQGRRPAMNPLHSGSLWSSYTFGDRLGLRGLGIGSGLVAKDAQFASTDNLARLPSYIRVDAALFYRRARYEIQANVQNLDNIRYYDAAQSDFQIYPAAPVTLSVTTKWHF